MTSDSEYVQDGPPISLKDDSGRTLVCQVEQTFEIEGKQYALLLPFDTPVEIFSWEEDEDNNGDSLVDVDERDIDQLFPTARAVLAEHDLTLQRSAVTLTVVGTIPEPDDEECFTLEIGEVDSQGEPDTEEFQTLATFFHKDIEYTVCTPVDPLLLFAQISDAGDARMIPPEEFERLRSEIESTIFDVLE
ncbi:DUF3727 domain-containing protein [Oscillatoria sp. CS-180]|uniref:DUF3727 domain-containing protein n=1 Tax=Oscillatoria sp. CS-180 TaxID=3021720 RepID=UPI00232FF453|nr:DUF3727 domain-containing protein [Oscillatoria sp. CS-180]MDB9528616.1 DUF3727 domain-containing protein [Oscillatoria sp. CS-180]